MALSVSTAFFILSCGFWVAETQHVGPTLTVPNGGSLGTWGAVDNCIDGHAIGFRLKVEPYGTALDSTALNGISLLCSGGVKIKSRIAPWGTWSKWQLCLRGKLVAFSLRVQEPNEKVDNTAANNIKFRCSDGTELMGTGNPRGTFGPWSNPCTKGFICGMQTRVQTPQYIGDDTALNDVRFFCCKQSMCIPPF